MLPGARTTAGKVAYLAGAILVIALCIWQATRGPGDGGLRTAEYPVVCDACGAVEMDRQVPVGDDVLPQVPVPCGTCGKPAAYVAHMCPQCGKPIPVDLDAPPTRCKHCGANLEGMFDRPAP